MSKIIELTEYREDPNVGDIECLPEGSQLVPSKDTTLLYLKDKDGSTIWAKGLIRQGDRISGPLTYSVIGGYHGQYKHTAPQPHPRPSERSKTPSVSKSKWVILLCCFTALNAVFTNNGGLASNAVLVALIFTFIDFVRRPKKG